MTTCIYLNESMTFAFNLTNNPECEGVCRSNYLLLYGQNLTQKGDEYTDFKVYIDSNDKMVACNSSTFANTTCADNVLGDIVEVRYTNTSSKAVQLCEIIIAGQTSENYSCTAGHAKKGGFCEKCSAGCGLEASCEGTTETNLVYGSYTWSDAKPADVLSESCQNNIDQMATKKCLASLKFAPTNFSSCKSPVSDDLDKIAYENITDDTQNQVSDQLADLTNKSSDAMSAEDISTASNIMTDLTKSVTTVDDRTLDNILKTASSISEKGQDDQLESSGGTVVTAVSDLASKLASQDNVTDEVKAAGSVAVIIPNESTDGSASELYLSADRRQKKTDLANSKNVGDSNTYFKAKVPFRAGTRVIGSFYANDRLFPVINAFAELKVIGNAQDGEVNKLAIGISINEAFKPSEGSNAKKGTTAKVETVATVISSISYANSTRSEQLTEKLELEYVVEDVQVATYRKVTLRKDVRCKFYNESTKAWSTDGCETVSVLAAGDYTVKCKCDHMTSFAVLMSFSGDFDPAEDNVTQMLLGASLVCLLATIVAFSPAEKMLKQRSVRINLLLVVSLIFAIIIFFMMDVVIEKDVSANTVPSKGCIAVGFLMNYFWLCQMAWMVLEAVTMYMVLVRVFGSHINKYMLKFNLLAWGIPLLFPTIGLAVGGTEYIDATTCFINKKYAYIVFYVPVLLCIIFNCVMFALVARVIFRSKAAGQVSEQQQKKRQFKSALAVMVLLGAGWVFGFLLIIEEVNTAPLRWLFIIVNCSQGILIFIFFVICNAELRKLWLQIIGIKETTRTTTSSSRSQRHQSKRADATLSTGVSVPSSSMPAKLDSTIYANKTPISKGGYTNSTEEIELEGRRAR